MNEPLGINIVRQGEVGDLFFIIESSALNWKSQSHYSPSGDHPSIVYQLGTYSKVCMYDAYMLCIVGYFGEMALMLNDTRHANCIAVGKVW